MSGYGLRIINIYRVYLKDVPIVYLQISPKLTPYRDRDY